MLQFRRRDGKRIQFEKPEEISPLLHTLLIARGIDSPEAAKRFLYPTVDGLHDPFTLSHMDEAVARIRHALNRHENICVFGDYDVDGVCASAILAHYLRLSGACVELYLPDRHSEGYGLNEAAVRDIASRCSLMITVDCGISCHREVALCATLGLDTIITDHHRPPEALPDTIIVHPQLGAYPCPVLCGAGVAFKVVHALGGLDAALQYVDLAALATVADIVPLKDENRVITTLGLRAINANPRPGVRALIESACLKEGQEITAASISYQLAPRINAGGRLATATLPSRLLLSESLDEARPLAAELEALNQSRRSMQEQIIREAKELIASFDFSAHRIIIIQHTGWNLGVVGLAAGKLTEEYQYPSIVLTDNGTLMTGSCRSIPGVDIHRALQSAEKLLDHYGGHAQAAGLSLRAENIPLLQNALDLWISENVPNAAYIPCREYDLDVSFDRLSVENVRELNLLEPTGCENPSPVFRAQPYVYRSRAVGIDKRHLQLSLSSNGVILNGIYFGAGQLEDNLPERVDILYEPGINAYNGSVNVQALVRALNTSDHNALFTRLRGHEAELQRNFLTDLFYNYRHRLLSCGGTAEVSIDALRHSLCASPQGTLILAADVQAMKRVLCATEGLSLDILTADQPVDPRSFNTLIVYPKGDLPKGFRRIICADMPHGYAGGALLAPEEHVAWTDEIPELEQLRTLYVQLKTLTQDSAPCTLRRATAELSARTGLPPNGALAGLYTLLDLELFRMDDCGRLVKAEKKRADPSKSGFYTGLMNWKHSLSDKN